MLSTMGGYNLPDNAAYDRYYHRVIELRRENTKKVVQEVMPIIQKILKEANSQDPRFSSAPIPMGSYYQGLKIKKADEFDMNVPLKGLGNYDWGMDERAYYDFDREVDDQLQTYPDDIRVVSKNVRLLDPPAGFSRLEKIDVHRMWQDPKLEKLDFGPHIIPFIVRRHYRKLVQAALRKHELQRTVTVSRRKHGPAVTLNIKLSSLAHDVSVDLSPVIETHLSIPPSCGFPHRGARWPSQLVQQQMLDAGISNTAHHDFEWRWSFVGPEQKMLDGMDADHGCRKKVLRILKGLAQDFWATSTKPALTSYHLKVSQIILSHVDASQREYQCTLLHVNLLNLSPKNIDRYL